MAADSGKILSDLLDFYDLSGKVLVSVGAGGGQLVGYGAAARGVLAVDSDPDAAQRLREAASRAGLAEKFDIHVGDFFEGSWKGDALLFEFCLHEMSDPRAALLRARSMAPDVLVIDHLPDSPWAYCVVEEEKARSGWRAMEGAGLRRRRSFSTPQRFADFFELRARVLPQGPEALRRIERHRSAGPIEIPMGYGLGLL